jgi:hypothetical protein
MRAARLLCFGVLIFFAVSTRGQQKNYAFVPQAPETFRIGPGFHRGVAVYSPRGWEALHLRLEIDSQQPVSVGVVRLEDWDHAAHNPEALVRLDYACLTEGVSHISFSCNFYPGDTSRVVVVRDTRSADRPVITGAAVPFARYAVNEVSANDVRVTAYRWECVGNCDLPDPPRLSWVDLRSEKFEITPAFKSYGPFTPDRDGDVLRVRVKSPTPLTVAVVSTSLADELYAHPDYAPQLLAASACKQYRVQSSTLECSLKKNDGPMQVILLPEARPRKKKAEITIATVQCVANCAGR